MKQFGLSLLLFFSLAGFAGANTQTDLEAAKEALRSRDLGKLERIADHLQGDPMEVYPRYWLISAQLDSIGDAQVRLFLQTFPGSLLADRLRGEWLKTVGKSERWDVFAAEYPALVNVDVELECYQLRGRLARQDGDALAAAKKLWLTSKDLPEACGVMFEALRQQGVLTPDNIWERERLALEGGNFALAKRLMALLPAGEGIAPKSIDAATDNPALQLKKQNYDLDRRAARAQPCATFSTCSTTSRTACSRSRARSTSSTSSTNTFSPPVLMHCEPRPRNTMVPSASTVPMSPRIDTRRPSGNVGKVLADFSGSL